MKLKYNPDLQRTQLLRSPLDTLSATGCLAWSPAAALALRRQREKIGKVNEDLQKLVQQFEIPHHVVIRVDS